MIAKFIGTQQGFEDLPEMDLYNVNAPGEAAHGTTFAVPAGFTILNAIAKAAMVIAKFNA